MFPFSERRAGDWELYLTSFIVNHTYFNTCTSAQPLVNTILFLNNETTFVQANVDALKRPHPNPSQTLLNNCVSRIDIKRSQMMNKLQY